MPDSEFPSLARWLEHYTLFMMSTRDGYTAWLEPSFGAASGKTPDIIAATIPALMQAVEEYCAK
jgi:hypothetical protein